MSPFEFECICNMVGIDKDHVTCIKHPYEDFYIFVDNNSGDLMFHVMHQAPGIIEVYFPQSDFHYRFNIPMDL